MVMRSDLNHCLGAVASPLTMSFPGMSIVEVRRTRRKKVGTTTLKKRRSQRVSVGWGERTSGSPRVFLTEGDGSDQKRRGEKLACTNSVCSTIISDDLISSIMVVVDWGEARLGGNRKTPSSLSGGAS